jgi:integrase
VSAPNVVGEVHVRNLYLTKHGQSWVFQRRLPKALDPDSSLAAIRIRLGALPLKQARRLAALLGAASQLIFERLIKENTMAEPETNLAITEGELREVVPFFRGLHAAADCNARNHKMAELMVDTGLEGLLALGADHTARSALASSQGPYLQKHFLDIIKDEQLARSYLGFEPLPPQQSILDNLSAGMERITSQVDSLVVQLQPKDTPLFSVAADKYIAKLKKSHGDDYIEARYLEHRRDVFVDIIGDKPVIEYTEENLQTFVDEICHLPPNYSRRKDYNVANIKLYIAENKIAKKVGLSANTLENNYVARVKTIIRVGCRSVGATYSLAKAELIIPTCSPLPRQQIPPDYPALQKVFRAGKDTGVLADLMLPLLGFLTGRRLAILVNLRAEDIIHYHGMWVVAPKSVVVDDGKRITIPIKTLDSLQFYVLNSFLERIGFIEWARQQKGFVFASLHDGVTDPEKTASKRMGRVFDRAGVSRALLQTFHGLRHARRNEDRDQKVDPATSRRQAGRKPADQHDEYGSGVISRLEVTGLATAPLPDEIDWSLFHNLDFDALAKNSRAKRREKSKEVKKKGR